MKRSLWLAVLGLLTAGLTMVAPSTASARPVCDGEYITTAYAGEQWRVTATHSDWGTGGTRVTVAKGKSATNRVRTVTTSTHSFDLGASYGPISAKYNYTHSATNDVTNSRTTTLRTAYSRTVPRRHQARMMRWGIQKLIRAKKYDFVYSSAKNRCVPRRLWAVTVAGPAAQGPFIWDMQDRATGRPGCKLSGYVSYGSCKAIKN